jgi:spermidine synthase
MPSQPVSASAAAAPGRARLILLACFFVSGFTALLYQTVWMRLALARFGVNTSVVATVLAVFMLGLAAGSFGAGRVLSLLTTRFGIGPLRVYGLAELTIGIGGLVVPSLLAGGRGLLLALGPASSAQYTLASAVLLGAILFPFCAAMGLTFPSAVSFLARAGASGEGRDPFSALYLANVAGAFSGALATPLVLIELFGFRATSLGAAAANASIAAVALGAFRGVALGPPAAPSALPAEPAVPRDAESRARRLALFITGFSTMGLEVVWTRIYPTIIGTFVYSFAAIIASYLLATTAGSALYRRLRHRPFAGHLGTVWPWLAAVSVLPLYAASVTFRIGQPFASEWLTGTSGWAVVRVAAGLLPFCALLGFLTPALIDREAGDDPAKVGRAYGINLLGCLVGPLVAGFILLPQVGARGATLALVIPLFAMLFAAPFRRGSGWAPRLAAAAAAGVLWFSTTLFEEQFPKVQVRHDHVATVVAAGDGQDKHLYVNGVGMTALTTITKMMAHFPAAHLSPGTGERLDTLVICFGMGTTFRSLASWDANVTAAELVPSVDAMFGYYFPDGPALLRETGRKLRVVHDDGRRFLDRTPDRFDIISIDPPPPVEAAGSSLLYSKEFYRSVRRALKAGGILQTWLPGGDRETVAGVVLAAYESFPHVRVFQSIEGFGFHVLASDAPIPRRGAGDLLARMPEPAVADMIEWIHDPPVQLLERMLTHEFAPDALLAQLRRGGSRAIVDDRPVNEFFFLRRFSR